MRSRAQISSHCHFQHYKLERKNHELLIAVRRAHLPANQFLRLVDALDVLDRDRSLAKRSLSGLRQQSLQLLRLLFELRRIGFGQAFEIRKFPSDARQLAQMLDAKQVPIGFVLRE